MNLPLFMKSHFLNKCPPHLILLVVISKTTQVLKMVVLFTFCRSLANRGQQDFQTCFCLIWFLVTCMKKVPALQRHTVFFTQLRCCLKLHQINSSLPAVSSAVDYKAQASSHFAVPTHWPVWHYVSFLPICIF